MASQTTREHDTIRAWADAHGATPTIVDRTGGMLRFEFTGDETNALEPVDWDDFFRVFDERDLELVYDDKPGSRFHKFVYPETIAAKSPGRSTSARAAARPRAARAGQGSSARAQKPATRKAKIAAAEAEAARKRPARTRIPTLVERKSGATKPRAGQGGRNQKTARPTSSRAAQAKPAEARRSASKRPANRRKAA